MRGLGPGRVQCVLDDFMCALQKRLLYQGRMFVFEHYVCFHSNLFGHKKDKVIPLQVPLASAPSLTPLGSRAFSMAPFLQHRTAVPSVLHDITAFCWCSGTRCCTSHALRCRSRDVDFSAKSTSPVGAAV